MLSLKFLTTHRTNSFPSALPVIEQFTQSTTFYFTADTAAFVARYPAPTVAVKYTFVPI